MTNKNNRKCQCGGKTFRAHQMSRHDICVDSTGAFVSDHGVYDSETPYGPFTCTECGAAYDELSDINTTASSCENPTKISVPYVSVWDGGIEVETTCMVNIQTGEVTDITGAGVEGLDIRDREYIVMNGEQVDVYADEHGYDYWADIHGAYEAEPDNGIITTRCVNGTLQAGDMVISTPSDAYACLIGRVMEINLVGTPEHNTDNETDDVHVNFVSDYSRKRIKEIEARFTGLYGQKKRYEDCPLDEVIMAPDCLIRITDISVQHISKLLKNGYFAACYCYKVLESLKDQPETDLASAQETRTEIEVKVFSIIESALALSGFKVMDGGSGYVIIRHSESDTDFEIKIEELPG